MRYPHFCGPSYASQSRLADAELLMNLYVEHLDQEAPGATVQMALYPTPGVVTRANLADAPIRGLFSQAGKAYVVAGKRLAAFDANYALTYYDAVAQDGNPATLTTNGDGGGQLFITTGNRGYVLDQTTGALTQVVPNSAVNGALMGGMLNGRFIVLDAASSTFGASELFDGLTWNAFMFAQRSTAPDPWKALVVSTATSKIYLIGEFTSDVWYDNGGGGSVFPYVPITGALIPYGTSAPFSVADYRGAIVWLAQNKDGDRVVVRLTGYSSAARISNHAVETALKTYDRIDDAESFIYQEEGHTFYVLTFPSANATWAFDDEGGWHQRGTWNVAKARYDAWHARGHVLAFGKHVVGDRYSGALSELSVNFGYDFGGAPLRRVRRTPGLQRELERVSYSHLRLYLENGLGLLTGQGVDPKVLYRYSNDGARTWGSFREHSAGRLGDYKIHVDFWQNGSAYDRVDEIVVSDPIPWRILDAFLEIGA